MLFVFILKELTEKLKPSGLEVDAKMAGQPNTQTGTELFERRTRGD